MNYPKHLVCFAMFFALVGSFCLPGIAEVESAEVIDRIVAIVNDEIIVLYELNQLFKPYAERIKAFRYPLKKEREMLFKVRGDLLNQIVDEKLTDQEVKRLNIFVGEKEIDATIERLKESKLFTDEELREELKKQGLTMETYRKGLKEQLLRTKLVNLEVKSKIVITKEDIKSYYEKNNKKYGGEKKYHLGHIFAKESSFAAEAQKRENFNEMKALRKKLKPGQPIKTLLGTYSDSSLDIGGGELGLFKLDELSPQIQKAIAGLKAGEFTPVMETDFGYQIIFVQAIAKNPGKSLEDVSAEIEEKLFKEIINKKFQSWLEDLRKRSHIKIIK